MTTSLQPALPKPAYARWFCYLLAASILCVLNPYFESPDSRYYSPTIGTYVEAPGGMTPTTSKIHLDGRTYGELTASQWLWWGLLLTGVEMAVFAFKRVRNRAVTPG
ncbi:MAG: hypothetical protein ACO1TE_19325 [Prosthecobacter sp.]